MCFMVCPPPQLKILATPMLKDELIGVGEDLKFPYIIELINSVKNARVKYFADMELQIAEVDCRERETAKNV